MVRYNDATELVTFTSIWVESLNHRDHSAGSGNEVTGNGSENGTAAESKGVVAGGEVVGAVIVGVILTTVVLCTVVGNVMVLLAVFVNSHLRSTTNYFIVNLAIADLLLGTTVLPFSASLEVFKKWLFGQVFCDIWAAIDVLCCTASIFSLCVISIDRYIGVTRPLRRSAIMTERRAVYVVLLIWLLALAISVAPLIGWKEPAGEDPHVCTVTTQTGYVLFSASASFYIPLSIILLVYFRIYREAIKHSRFLSTGVKTTKVDESGGVTLRVHKGAATGCVLSSSSSPPSGHQSSSSSERSECSLGQKTPVRMTAAGRVARFRRETKAAKTLGIVVGVFILCWFPFFFILPLGSLCPSCNIPPLLFNIFFWLGYCNSLMNPVIYACSSREFRFAFRRILRCKFRRRPRVFLKYDHESSSLYELNHVDHHHHQQQQQHHGVNARGSRATQQQQNGKLKPPRKQKPRKSRQGRLSRTFKSCKSSFPSSSSTRLSAPPAVPVRGFTNVSSSSSNPDLHRRGSSESPTQSVTASELLEQKPAEELDRSGSLTVLGLHHTQSSMGFHRFPLQLDVELNAVHIHS
ncbi:alpha-1A adrenergic receptor-like [Babylonia areolata]|uniref:alpha-1A adrenergic receptor-like n=1 Tax=Babylonia areolata TaxID=304850 RepID=UPI003FD569F8